MLIRLNTLVFRILAAEAEEIAENLPNVVTHIKLTSRISFCLSRTIEL